MSIKKFCKTILFSFCILHCFGQQTMGLFINQQQSYNGYTLFSNNENSYLIDNCGFIVNSWASDYKSGHGIYITPNGDLLRAGSVSGSFNAGGRGGIVELFNWEGSKLWQGVFASDQIHAHHDIELLPNGNFLITVWEKRTEQEAKAKGRKYSGEVWSEKILEVQILSNNNHQVVWEWSAWDHLIQDYDPSKENYGLISINPQLIDINFIGEASDESANWLHINAIAYNEEFDQIAICSRNLSEIYIIDHSTSTSEASSSNGGNYNRGGDILFRYGNPQAYKNGTASDQVLNKPHDIKWVDDFTFSIFNNEYIPQNRSQALVFKSPAELDGSFTYSNTDLFGEIETLFSFTQLGFYSVIMSSLQVLPNGNMLILEGNSGHLFEITPDEDVVWDYINPVNRNGGPGIQSGEPKFNSLFRALRYPTSYPGFENEDLSPTIPIELSPYESDCEIFQNTSINYTVDSGRSNKIYLKTNPAKNYLSVENLTTIPYDLIIINSVGQKVLNSIVIPGQNEIDISSLESGSYFSQYLDPIGFTHSEVLIISN